jgi:hypothetical protein
VLLRYLAGLRYARGAMAFIADRISVQITIESETLSPEQISESVGMPADVARRMGEARGHMGKGWERNVWQIRALREGTESTNVHYLLPLCIQELLQRTQGISTGLRRVVALLGGEFAVHVTSTDIPGITISSEQIRRVADFGLSLDIDLVLVASDGQ